MGRDVGNQTWSAIKIVDKKCLDYSVAANSILYNNKEGRKCFNDVLNTFLLRLYDVGHVVKDLSDSRIVVYAPWHRRYSIPGPLL